MATYSVKDLCKKFAVGEHTILAWVRSGELIGLNVSRKTGGKPKWRFTESAVEAFMAMRATSTPQPRTRVRERSTDIIEFYK